MPNGIKPPRTPWGDFPDAVLHASETAVKTHPAYWAAKTGDFDAAVRLVSDTISIPAAMAIGRIAKGRNVLVVSVHAFEQAGVNAIPEALAEQLYYMNGLQPDGAIVQANEVGHTGASGFSRLARQAKFTGPVAKRRLYFLVDDFIGQGGTLANLRGYIESAGGHVIGASALTGRADSAKLSPDRQLLERLRGKHGKALENWWIEHFGHAFDCLTQSEARYLEQTANADRIRDRIAAAQQAGNG